MVYSPMCFSANASFSAGIVLTAIGVFSIRKAQNPSHLLFAGIPLIFAIQQLTEGIVWLTLLNPGYAVLLKIATFVFLFFAQVLWPLWVPVAILLLEKEGTRMKFQKLLVGMGALVSFYLAYCLFRYPVRAEIVGYHITYRQDYPAALANIGAVLYVISTIAPAFFSHIKRMWMLGVTVLVSYLVTELFYEHYIVSVWCFFASVISISVLVIMLEIKKYFLLRPQTT
jgi:hypothetical protein